MAHKAISLNPSTFVQGGLINNIDVRIENARFTLFNYGGKGEAAAGLMCNLRDLRTGEVHAEQFWSAGGKVQPDQSGQYLIYDDSQGGEQHLTKNSNLSLFLASLVKEGVPGALLDAGSAFALNGITIHVNRKKITELDPGRNINSTDAKREPEVLVCTKLLALPGEGTTPTGTPIGTPATVPMAAAPMPAAAPVPSTPPWVAPAASTPAGPDPAISTAVQQILMELVPTLQFPMPMQAFNTAVFAAVMKSPIPMAQRASAMPLVVSMLPVVGLMTDGTMVKLV